MKIDLDVYERLIQGGEFSQDDAEGFTDKVLSFFKEKIREVENLRSTLNKLDQSSYGASTGHDGLNQMLGLIMSMSLERERIRAEVYSLMKLE